MFRYLVAHLPTFRLDRCGYTPDQLVALVAEQKSALRVQTPSLAAARAGVRAGMTAAQAQAIAPGLILEVLDPIGEQEDLEALTAQLLRVSPAVAPLAPDALVAEVGRNGLAASALGAPTAGRERALLERVRIRLEHLGHHCTVVVADDPLTARACAEHGRRCQIVRSGQAAEALAPLPLAALELPVAEHGLLIGLGITTVAAFACLPAASVVGRLGPAAVAAHALAQGRGRTPAVALWDDSGPLSLSQELPQAVVQLDALLFVLNALLRDATARLVAAGKAATRLRLRFSLDADLAETDPARRSLGLGSTADLVGGWQELSVRLGEPTRDARRILSLLRLRLERTQLAAPVTRLVLELPEAVPFDGRQADLDGRHRAGEALAEVSSRLQDTLGSESVLVPQRASRHRPEAEWRPRPFALSAAGDTMASAATGTTGAPASRTLALGTTAAASGQAQALLPTDALARSRADKTDPVREWQGFPSPVAPRRPSLLLHPPCALDVRLSPPTASGSALPRAMCHDARWHDIVGVQGPERLSGEWWSRTFGREYWRVALADDRRAWIYREDGRWFLHGWFDA